MIKNYILGTGYLSEQLNKLILNSYVLPAKKFIEEINNINNSKKKINLIINSFYSSRNLSNIYSYKIFIDKSLTEIAEIFDKIDPKKIKKILYTSSSSVYGSINNDIKINDKNNRFLYSNLKLYLETFVKNFCNTNNININICRVFNIYGGKDDFSIIHKFILLKKKKINKLKINNNGESIRDFINVVDVAKIYKKLLLNNNSEILDIGTGKGLKIIDIIDNLNIKKKKLFFNKTKSYEIIESIADITKLNRIIGKYKFLSLKNFLKLKNPINYTEKTKKNLFEKTLSGSVIYGAGYSGRKLAKQMSNLQNNSISFFIDDNINIVGKTLDNIKVISFHDLKKISKSTIINNIIIAIPSLSEQAKLRLIKKLLTISSSISSLPSKEFYKQREINFEDINLINLEELFIKKHFELKNKLLNNFKDKNILVTGGAGSIGSEISNQIVNYKPNKIIILDHSEFNIYRLSIKLKNNRIKFLLGDIKDTEFIEKIIKQYNIQYIFHAAAYKHVKFLEQNKLSAIKNNIIGTYSIIQAIKNKNLKLIFISTDKAVKPKNILGITKRIGELLIQLIFKKKEYLKSNYSIVRFGNVIGSDGSALPYFLNQIKRDLPITLTDKKMERYFMSIREACDLVLKSTTLESRNKIFFLDMGKPIKILNIIKKMFDIYKKNNQRLKIKIIGNKYNEKISEKLTYKEKIKKTKINKVYFVKDTLPDPINFFKFFEKIILSTETSKVNLILKKIINQK